MATIPIPINEINPAKNFPHTVIGTTSPYPTVASETVAHHKEAVILENTSGCASFSKKQIAEAEKRIHSNDKKNVNFNSFWTADIAFMKSFKDLLSRPSLNILDNRNSLKILKKRPSIKTNCLM